MIVELWLLPAVVTAFVFWKAIRTAVEITETLGADGLGVFARVLTWSVNLAVASAFSALAWALWWVWA